MNVDVTIFFIKDVNSEFGYSQKSCSVCCELCVNGDHIAWSRNEQCWHAYHVDCILYCGMACETS
jgi:hypothetical protein